MIKELIEKARSYRRFDESYKLTKEDLLELVDVARLGGSGANLQPLKYYLSADDETNETIFETLKWAGYLKDWKGPEKGEKPTGYIGIVQDIRVSKIKYWDHGIAAQNILLAAAEKDLGGCMFASFGRELHEKLNLKDNHELLMIIALGKPTEEIEMVDISKDESVKYYRDENQKHYVPKRKLEDIIL